MVQRFWTTVNIVDRRIKAYGFRYTEYFFTKSMLLKDESTTCEDIEAPAIPAFREYRHAICKPELEI